MRNSEKSLKKNIALNGLQQLITFVIPLISVPYLTRVIGKDGIGIYSFTSSIIQYFILFGTIGMSLYGTREIAYVRENKDKRDQVFCRILLLRMLFCGLSLVLYSFVLFFYETSLKLYLSIQIIALLANAIDISWFFQGIEEFNKTVLSITLSKVIGLICIFLFVHSEQDIWVYVLIQVLTLLFGNLVMWFPATRIITFRRVRIRDAFSILRPVIALFIPQIAIELYAVFDKTMLGMLSTIGDVGLYEKAEQFAKMPLMLVTVIATVLFPRMSNLFAEEGKDALDEGLNNNIRIISFIGVGASFGVAGIANGFVPWMMGDEFLGSIPLMQILAPLSFFIGLSNMIGRQYLLPSNQNRAFTLTVSIGAGFNFLLNLLLIPAYGASGACAATLIAEGMVTIIQFAIVRKHIRKKEYFKDLLLCMISGFIMLVLVICLGRIISIPVLNTLVQIGAGVLVYYCILLMFKNQLASQIFSEIALVFKKKTGNT